MRKKAGFGAVGFLAILLVVMLVFLAGYGLGKQRATQEVFPGVTGNIPYDTGRYREKEQTIIEEPFSASFSGKVITHGPRDRKRIALTFDAEMTDGMKAALLNGRVKSSYDSRIVDILRQTQTKATFFLTGMWIELYPGETRELENDPLFELGSHSYTDSSFAGGCFGLRAIPADQMVEEIGATEKLLRKYAGINNRLFRFPGGCYNQQTVQLVNEAYDIVVHWDVNGSDGFNNNSGSIVRSVLNGVKNGSIIILHLNGAPTAPATAEALPEIIRVLKGQGYEFVKVTELLGIPPITAQPG